MTTAQFTIDLTPDPAGDLEGAVGRFAFTKVWSGDIEGAGRGVMLSGGDPGTGAAGYVAIEVFDGVIDGRRGTVRFQQLGSVADGVQRLDYLVVPGSGTDELAGLTGTIALEVVDGVHRVRLDHETRLP